MELPNKKRLTAFMMFAAVVAALWAIFHESTPARDAITSLIGTGSAVPMAASTADAIVHPSETDPQSGAALSYGPDGHPLQYLNVASQPNPALVSYARDVDLAYPSSSTVTLMQSLLSSNPAYVDRFKANVSTVYYFGQPTDARAAAPGAAISLQDGIIHRGSEGGGFV